MYCVCLYLLRSLSGPIKLIMGHFLEEFEL
jgi:hypothetical protein